MRLSVDSLLDKVLPDVILGVGYIVNHLHPPIYSFEIHNDLGLFEREITARMSPSSLFGRKVEILENLKHNLKLNFHRNS